MKILFILSLLLLSGCSCNSNKTAATANVIEDKEHKLMYSEDKERGVICYRFKYNDGIFCMNNPNPSNNGF